MPHLFTTETKNYRPLERRNDYPWEILRERLVRELGAEFSLFLAEPVTRAAEGFVDWYTESTELAISASDLSPAEREKLFGRLDLMRIRIYELADRINAPGPDADKRFSDALRRITVVPDDHRFVWSLGGQPVLILWGMLHVDDLRSETEVLGEALRYRDPQARPVVAPPPVPPPPEVVVRRRFPFASLLWLLFAALTGVIYYLLFMKCDVAIGPHMALLSHFGINACVSPFANDAAARRRELEERIRKAELDLARIQGDCATPVARATPPRPVPPPPPQPPRPTVKDVCDELKVRGGSCNPNAKLQVSLFWKGLEDVDLHVECPGGEITYSDKHACSGHFDIDTNSEENAKPPAYNAVENAEWINPPRGRYIVKVNLYQLRSQTPRDIPFTVLVRCGDQPPKTMDGHISRTGQTVEVAEVDYSSCAMTQR
ncbi:MAG TPA: hypothetical protein VKR55_14780 [Bradyrhizobium sp.]|uniref:hypothetical protein n=1 Tax=Bradyrhizobium sp. TaxID=376 RepID=UPI002D02B9AF|nr:hypothetical protein [Bradyrhizobium sp.]HLZ03401.1 hypothetical protein [Bradyrhizobium sp.]